MCTLFIFLGSYFAIQLGLKFCYGITRLVNKVSLCEAFPVTPNHTHHTLISTPE